jgi:phosphate transport system protein
MGDSLHTVRGFDTDLRNLTRMTAGMGGRAEKQVVEAVDALVACDGERGREVVLADALIDAAQREIESKAVATIATRQPMAVDLREVIGALRIANELERIGDLAKNIGKRVIALDGASVPRQPLRGIVQIADLAAMLLRNVLDSYAERDSEKAIEVWREDEKIDAFYGWLFRDLVAFTTEHPRAVTLGIHLLFCAKNLERIGDHAANIAQSVHYIVSGHPFSGESRKSGTGGRSGEKPPAAILTRRATFVS